MNEDFLERLHMADQDDDEDDLSQLKQLRQVWLAMPDEEPPTKGLDALMAAARTKAEEMKPAPWWKRMFAVMVTPPALALATVIVVAGGAVLVHNHRDEVEKHEQVATEGKSAEVAADGVIAAQGSAAPVATPPAAQRVSDKLDEKEKKDVVDAPKPKPSVVTKKPSAHAGSKGGKGESLYRSDDEQLDTLKLSQRTEPPPPPPPPPPAQKAPVEKPVDRAPAKPMPDTGMDASGAAAPTTPTAANSQSNAQPMAAQLLVKARAAAERNDCATVKQLLEQIAKLDGAYYRNTAAKDATVGRCMQIAD